MQANFELGQAQDDSDLWAEIQERHSNIDYSNISPEQLFERCAYLAALLKADPEIAQARVREYKDNPDKIKEDYPELFSSSDREKDSDERWDNLADRLRNRLKDRDAETTNNKQGEHSSSVNSNTQPIREKPALVEAVISRLAQTEEAPFHKTPKEIISDTEADASDERKRPMLTSIEDYVLRADEKIDQAVHIEPEPKTTSDKEAGKVQPVRRAQKNSKETTKPIKLKSASNKKQQVKNTAHNAASRKLDKPPEKKAAKKERGYQKTVEVESLGGDKAKTKETETVLGESPAEALLAEEAAPTEAYTAQEDSRPNANQLFTGMDYLDQELLGLDYQEAEAVEELGSLDGLNETYDGTIEAELPFSLEVADEAGVLALIPDSVVWLHAQPEEQTQLSYEADVIELYETFLTIISEDSEVSKPAEELILTSEESYDLEDDGFSRALLKHEANTPIFDTFIKQQQEVMDEGLSLGEVLQQADKQGLEQTFAQLAEVLENNLPTADDQEEYLELTNVLSAIQEELSVCMVSNEETGEVALKVTPELIQQLVALVKFLGYEHPKEVITSLIELYGMAFLIEALQYLCDLNNPINQIEFFRGQTAISASNNTGSNLHLRIGKVLLRLIVKPNLNPALSIVA